MMNATRWMGTIIELAWCRGSFRHLSAGRAVRLLMACVVVCATTAMTRGADKGIVLPTLSSEGRITSGPKSIWQKDMYAQFIFCIDNDVIGTFMEAYNFGKGDIGPVFFLKKEQLRTENGSLLTARLRDTTASDVELGDYRQQMSLLDNGMIRLESICLPDDPALLQRRHAGLHMPDYLTLHGEIVRNGKAVPFDASKSLAYSAADLKGATFRFFTDEPGKSFAIIPEACDGMTIYQNKIGFTAPADGRLALLLDIRSEAIEEDASELSPGGINFWEVDRLHLPDFNASRNLVQNPSFEAGFRYWGNPTYVHSSMPLKYKNMYQIDPDVAHTGSQSLRLRALRFRSASSIGTLALHYVPDENYTISFYAKGDRDQHLNLNVWARGRLQHFEPSVLAFPVTTEWQRFSIPVKAIERFGSIYFDAQLMLGESDEEGVVWLDDVQLEKGELTEFVQPVFSAQLTSAARGNFLRFGDSPDFNFILKTTPNQAGTVKLAVEDYFFKTFFENTYAFQADADGVATIALDDLTGRVVGSGTRGQFIVSASLNFDGNDRTYTDYFRFSVMDFLDNTHRNKNLFNLTYAYSQQAGGPEMDRYLERERAIGFGSFAYDFVKFANDMDYSHDKERMELTARYGLESMGRPMLKLHDGEGGEISEGQGAVVMSGIKSMIDPTDEQLAQFEAIAEQKARSRPWNHMWWFTGESNPGVMPLEAHPDAFAKFLLATLRGAKKGNPDSIVLIEGGPWNIDPNYGTKWVERYIQDTRRLDPTAKFDGAAAHYYQNFPENPDLDASVQAFIDMLDRNGLSDWPVYLNEGGNYAPFNIPQEGISPYISHSANWWYFGSLSYHYGRSERIANAFSARNWLVALKYQNRVACMQDFNTPNRYVDFDFTARPYDKIPNTLGRLLGNAAFYKDVRFGPDTRCYVFVGDGTDVPIAVVWGTKESVDRWKEEAPLYAFDFKGQSLTFIDLMENEVTFEQDSAGRTVLPASPFPIFIKGEAGSKDALFDAIAGGVASSGGSSALNLSAYPGPNGQATIVFDNSVSRPFDGSATVTLNGNAQTFPVRLGALQSDQKQLPIGTAALGRAIPFSASIAIDDAHPQEISGRFTLLRPTPALSVNTSLADWRKQPAIDMDGGYTARLAVTDKQLLILLEAPAGQSADERFAGTGLYVDTFSRIEDWANARQINQDLAVFELVSQADGSLGALCHFVQGTQHGSGNTYLRSGEVQQRIAVKALGDADGQAIVLAIPPEVLAPLEYTPGARFGINIAIPADGGAHTLAPIEPFRSARDVGAIRLLTVFVTR